MLNNSGICFILFPESNWKNLAEKVVQEHYPDFKMLRYNVLPARNPTYLARKEVKVNPSQQRQTSLAFRRGLAGGLSFHKVGSWLSWSYERDT